MAGSYDHIVAEDGQLLVNGDFVWMIENLGDAYEMAEEMYGMIWWLASEVSQQLLEEPAHYIQRARAEYKAGLGLSPGTAGRIKKA